METENGSIYDAFHFDLTRAKTYLQKHSKISTTFFTRSGLVLPTTGKDTMIPICTKKNKFITVLHSQDHDRKGYWPTKNKTGQLDFGHLPEPPKLYLNSLSERSGRNLILHTFKFAKIQTWIGQWGHLNLKQSDGKTGIIKENNAHPFFVGASSLIDSISATIRSHILAEKGPVQSSLTVEVEFHICRIKVMRKRRDGLRVWCQTH